MKFLKFSQIISYLISASAASDFDNEISLRLNLNHKYEGALFNRNIERYGTREIMFDTSTRYTSLKSSQIDKADEEYTTMAEKVSLDY